MATDPITGWYYLHTNGSLIFKRHPFMPDAGSPFVQRVWPVAFDRMCAWVILVEALSLGANLERVMELAKKWHCTDEDAAVYVSELNKRACLVHDHIKLYKDGDQWCAIYGDFANLQESPAGFGETALEALAALPKPGLQKAVAGGS